MKFKIGDYAQLRVGYWGRIIKIVKPVGKNPNFSSPSGLDKKHVITIRFLEPNNPIYFKTEESFYEDSFVAFCDFFEPNDVLKSML